MELTLHETTLAARLGGIGKLSRNDALRLGAVGPVARASSIPDDVRSIDPYAAYSEFPFHVVTDDHCDVFGRAVVRVKEIIESIQMIRFGLENLPDGELKVNAPRKIPEGNSESYGSASWRGYTLRACVRYGKTGPCTGAGCIGSKLA